MNSHVDTTSQTQNIISFCTGMRGLERGLERAGVNVRAICYVEIEAFIIENLVKQMEESVLDETPIWSNLKTFPAQIFRGKVHGITGGYPCQPFSVAGQRKGAQDPRHLWPFIKEHVSAIKPVWCFFENVPGHLTLGFREVKSDLEQLGYRVEAGIFSAEEVGATQIRRRLYILALADSDSLGKERIIRAFQGASEKNEGEAQGQDREWMRPGLRNGGENVEHSSSAGLQGHSRNDSREEGWSQQKRSASQASVFPAPQGYYQHEWEEPRIKPMLEFTVNGYNFRDDLLRMAGNGVVEQTAKLAWITLLKKHNINASL